MTTAQFSQLPSTTQVMFLIATSIGLSLSHNQSKGMEVAMSEGILEGLLLVEQIQGDKVSAGVSRLLESRISRIPETSYIPDEEVIRKQLLSLISEKNNEVLKQA